MSKEKLAIISSYNDLCGNASYTTALADGLSFNYDVTVIPLNVELLRKGKAKNAWAHVQKICSQLKAFDCVNIQFEAGLFGITTSSIKKHFFAIAKASKRLVLTMHRFHDIKPYPGILFLGKTFLDCWFNAFLREWQQTYDHNRWAYLYRSVVKFCKSRKIPIIVHTPRDRILIQEIFNYSQVFDHPLSFYDQAYLRSVSETYSKVDFCRDFSLDPNCNYIGIFGFINRYKGHRTAIEALQYLPDNYQLLIFGAQHPHTIKISETINEYIASLLKLIDKMDLSHRVKFYRLSSDDQFLKALMSCDFNILPYLEVNQGGSAIAALSLETHSNSIFSQNCAFFELAKYAPNAFKMFSIGNYLELANAILTYRKSEFSADLDAYNKKYNISTSCRLHQKLLSPGSVEEEIVFDELPVFIRNN